MELTFQCADRLSGNEDLEAFDIEIGYASDYCRDLLEWPTDVAVGREGNQIPVVNVHHFRDHRSRRAAKNSEVAQLGRDVVIRRDARVDVLANHFLPTRRRGSRCIDEQRTLDGDDADLN